MGEGEKEREGRLYRQASVRSSVLSHHNKKLGSVSSQQRFEVTDIKALGATQLSGLGLCDSS